MIFKPSLNAIYIDGYIGSVIIDGYIGSVMHNSSPFRKKHHSSPNCLHSSSEESKDKPYLDLVFLKRGPLSHDSSLSLSLSSSKLVSSANTSS